VKPSSRPSAQPATTPPARRPPHFSAISASVRGPRRQPSGRSRLDPGAVLRASRPRLWLGPRLRAAPLSSPPPVRPSWPSCSGLSTSSRCSSSSKTSCAAPRPPAGSVHPIGTPTPSSGCAPRSASWRGGVVTWSSCAKTRLRLVKPIRCRCSAGREGGRARVWTFTARSAEGRPLLLHAKFALSDRRLGYLGSANMTRQGFGDHLEIGTRLPEVETARLVDFLEALCAAGLLQPRYS
jgi:hypothetical protein